MNQIRKFDRHYKVINPSRPLLSQKQKTIFMAIILLFCAMLTVFTAVLMYKSGFYPTFNAIINGIFNLMDYVFEVDRC